MGNGAIGVPDTSQLPIQSNLSQYDLRNAAVAMTPQVQPPPEMTPDQSIQELQQDATASFLRPQSQYQIPPDSQQQQPPQFDQSQFSPLHPLVSQLMDQFNQQNQQRGHGVKGFLSSAFGGMGRAMMVHAGLPTPEMQHERQLQQLVDLSNADANQQLKNVELARYKMDVAPATVIDPRNGQPVLGPDGQPLTMAKWQAERVQQGLVEQMNQRPERWTPEQQVYTKSYDQYIQEGKTPAEAHALLQKQPADITPDRETFNYYTRPKAEGGLGLSPAQAYSAMHPRQNLTMGSTDVKDIADAIESGDQPPTLQGLYRNAGPVRAELARRGVPIARMEMDWNATKKYMGTLNGPQQVRLRQAIETAGDSLDKIQGLYDEWRKLAPVSGFKIANHAALVAMKNLPGRAGAVANALDAQIADLTAELGNVYMGGNSPTDHSLKLAQQNLSSDWGPDAFAEAMKQARLNIGIRKNSITHGAPAGVSGENTYMPPQPASPQTPAAVDPFAQFGGKSR